MPDPITLSALTPERQVLRIEIEKDKFEEYDMALADDLSLSQRRDLSQSWLKLNQLEEKEELTKADDLEFERLSKRLVKLVVPSLPKELNDAMPRGTREGITIAFFGNLSDPRKQALIQMIASQIQTQTQTGVSISDNSNDSTEEIQNNGSTSPSDSLVSI